MGLDEVGTARTLREHRKVTDALVVKQRLPMSQMGSAVTRMSACGREADVSRARCERLQMTQLRHWPV
jgi:hypothetical protein